jgi:hypothetical protein
MTWTDDELDAIYDRTSGKCHICHKKLSRSNYAKFGERGAWEVEHSNARANGGTDRLNNLYAAHIPCNRAKGTCGTRTARAWNGKSCAPLSRENRKVAREKNALAGASGGALIGIAIAGPPGAVVGGILGFLAGRNKNPDVK